MSGADGTDRAARLREAAALVVACSHPSTAMHDSTGQPAAWLAPAAAKPVAAWLLGAAVRLEADGVAAGQSLTHALELAGVLLHEDLTA